MSIHYSRFGLNTYSSTPYFQAHIPDGYDIGTTCLAAKSYRNLPPNVKKLATKAKDWATRFYEGRPPYMPDIDRFYDNDGNELNPNTGTPLTDEQIEQEWEGLIAPGADLPLEDIPIPKGGFSDPATWQPETESDEPHEYEGPSREQIRRDIKSHGIAYTARYYGVPVGKSEEELAETIFAKLGTPDAQEPAPSSS